MKKQFYIFFFTLFIHSLNFAIIVEHKEFSSILSYLTQDDYHKNTLIILDIDNTIATVHKPFEHLGTDAWAQYAVNKLIESGVNPTQAWAEVLPLYFELTHIIDLKPVEPTTPEIIKTLQDAGVTVIACTVRSLEILERTIAQLKTIGIDLTYSGFGHQEICGTDIIYCYKNGIIFCHGNDKGHILNKVLSHFDHAPVKVIMIDDRQKYLHQVEKVLHPDITFIGIRYGHLDEAVAQFDPVVAEQELLAYLAGKKCA